MTDRIKERIEGADLLPFEIEVLEMLDGRKSLPWGAAVSVALEHLSGLGLATKHLPYRITDEGRSLLTALKDSDNG